jgi:hypothetical protein
MRAAPFHDGAYRHVTNPPRAEERTRGRELFANPFPRCGRSRCIHFDEERLDDLRERLLLSVLVREPLLDEVALLDDLRAPPLRDSLVLGEHDAPLPPVRVAVVQDLTPALLAAN